MKHAFESVVFWTVVAALMLSLVSAVSKASEREHDHQTINNIIQKDGNQGKNVLLGMLIACRLNAVRAALFEGRWWTWCGGTDKRSALEAGDFSIKIEMVDVVNRLRDGRQFGVAP